MEKTKKPIFVAIISFLLLVCCVFMVACGKGGQIDTPIDFDGKQVLVTYFSATNSTEKVAGYISQKLNADLVEILPLVPYTSEDLNWNNPNSRVSQEHNNPASRPEINMTLENLDKYDIIFLGYPIWWGEAPNIIYTFLETYGDELAGKIIVPFCTSSSSGMGSSANHLHALVDSSATWKIGKRFSSGVSGNTVENWVDELSA